MSSHLKKCTYLPCTFTTFHSTTLRDHLTTHTGEKPYKCDFDGCNVALTTSGALCRHKRLENHIKNKVICECGYVTMSERGLQIHKAKTCKLISDKRVKLKYIKTNLNLNKPSFVTNSIKKMKCNHCNFNDIPDNLLKHMKSNVCKWSKESKESKEYKPNNFNDVLKKLMDNNYTDIKFNDFGFFYTQDALKMAINSITSNNYLDTFKKQMSNYGFFAQDHDGDKKYMYRTFPHQNGFPYKPLTSLERSKIIQTYKTNSRKIFKYFETDDDMTVLDES